MARNYSNARLLSVYYLQKGLYRFNSFCFSCKGGWRRPVIFFSLAELAASTPKINQINRRFIGVVIKVENDTWYCKIFVEDFVSGDNTRPTHIYYLPNTLRAQKMTNFIIREVSLECHITFCEFPTLCHTGMRMLCNFGNFYFPSCVGTVITVISLANFSAAATSEF